MTDFRMRLIIETILKDEKLLRTLKKDLEKIKPASDKGSKGLKGFTDKINSMKGKIVAATAILVGFGLSVKKAFDFAREGAAVRQMGESFDLFLKQAGNVPNLLNDLKFAARGTITDFNLMSSTMTLVMGATGDLKEELLEATPQLLEMAKAANKLNPALGSVEFLYESLARGIKRASPLILDNLGVIIKVGEAYQTFADKMGISIKAMTAVQKTQAVLDAALLAGEALISQVGGTTDALTDSYDRLTTHVINSKNAFLSWLSEGVEPVIIALDVLAFGSEDILDGIDKITLAVLDGSLAYDDYRKILDDLAAQSRKSIFINDLTISTQDELSVQMRGMSQEFKDRLGIVIAITEAEVNRTEELQFHIQVQKRMNQAIENAELLDYAEELILIEQAAEDAAQAEIDLAEAVLSANDAFATARDSFINDPFSNLNTGIVSRLEDLISNMDFALAGGQIAEDFTNAINTALFDNAITPAQARVLWEGILVAAHLVEVDLNNVGIWDASRTLAKTLGIEVSAAFAMLADAVPLAELEADLAEMERLTALTLAQMQTEIDMGIPGAEERLADFLGISGLDDTADTVAGKLATEFGVARDVIVELGEELVFMKDDLVKAGEEGQEVVDIIGLLKDKTITITVNYVSTGTIPTSGQAHGLNMTIPQGFPNDSFHLPLNVQSGEVVTVTPQGRTPSGSGGETKTDIHMNAPVYINSEANLSLEEMIAINIPRYNI